MVEYKYEFPDFYFDMSESVSYDRNHEIYVSLSDISNKHDVKITVTRYISKKFSRGDSFYSLFDIQCENEKIHNMCKSLVEHQYLVPLFFWKEYKGRKDVIEDVSSFLR